MKPKKLSKKLVLKKETVANLEMPQMKKVKGGCVQTYPSCSVTPWPCETTTEETIRC